MECLLDGVTPIRIEPPFFEHFEGMTVTAPYEHPKPRIGQVLYSDTKTGFLIMDVQPAPQGPQLAPARYTLTLGEMIKKNN